MSEMSIGGRAGSLTWWVSSAFRKVRNVYYEYSPQQVWARESGGDCDELVADWMTVCQLFLENCDTVMPYSEVK